MDIEISNFGTIASAKVNISGLTVIAGENDTGKSTIGKIFFSLVKAISRYEEDLKEDKEAKILELAEKVYFSLRKKIDFSTHEKLRYEFHPRRLSDHLRLYSDAAIYDRVNILGALLESGDISKDSYNEYISLLNDVRTVFLENDDKYTTISKAIKRAFYSEFKGDIYPKGKLSPVKCSLSINDGESALLNIEWLKDGVSKFNFWDNLGFDDATFVDSPAIMQFHHLVSVAKTLFDANNSGALFTVPLHVKDLAAKLKDSVYFHNIDSGYSDVSFNLKRTYQGNLFFDSESSEFLLDRGSYKISASNVASGIKSIGIFDLLVQSGHCRKNSLLILDEPEVNLHPKWQIEYAKNICDLVSNGATIIVTTHSPYMVEALNGYGKKYNISPKFYLANKMEDSSVISDVTGNVSEIFDALAQPLYDLNDEFSDDF